MKKMFSTLAVFTAAIVSLTAAEVIQLPAPDKTGGKPLMQALTERQTNRDFKKDALALQEISNLFYAACGINRADSGKLTIPTALNMQNLIVYAAMESGLYRYDAKKNQLIPVKDADLRGYTFMRKEMPLSAPLVMIYTADISKGRDADSTLMMSNAHAGSAYQNVYLYCASKGLSVVICGGFDKKVLAKQMGITDRQAVLYTQIIGWPAK